MAALQVILAAIEKSDGTRKGVNAAVFGGSGITISAADSVLGKEIKIDPKTGDVNTIDITVEVSKDVSWDQKALQAIWSRMVAAGQDPTEFISAKYSVSESRFKAWPEVFRQPFMAARTVKPKAAKFTLRKPSASEGAQ